MAILALPRSPDVAQGNVPGPPRPSFDFGRDRDEQRFWDFYLRSSFIVQAGESAGVLGYLLLSPNGPHRLALEMVVGLVAVASLAVLPWVGRIGKRAWRSEFSLCMALLSGAVVAMCAVLDGGVNSPLLFLLALPVANAALGVAVWAEWVCVGAALLEVTVVAVSDPHITSSVDYLVVVGSFLTGAGLLALGWAINRSRGEKRQAIMFDELVRLALTDTLTGCLNHGAFFERLESEVDRAARLSEPLSLLVVDLDLFKAFNDTHGHLAGDDALCWVGAAAKRSSRSYDIVGRVGGDEFAVVLPNTALPTARGVADRMCKALEGRDGRGVTVSIGAAALNSSEPTSKRLFRDADSALYRAKAGGRARAASRLDTDGPSRRADRPSAAPTAELLADLRLADERLLEARTTVGEAWAILDALETADSVGFAFVGPDFRILRINSVWAAVNGGTVADQLGRTVAEVAPHLWPRFGPAYQTVLETGSALTNLEITGEVALDPGRRHYWLVHLYPVRAHGDPTGICVVALDITDRKELEDHQVSTTRSVVAALAAAVEARDPYTDGHQQRVAEISVAIASELGLGAQEIDRIDLAARIHDVGKLAVPAEVLARPGRLSEAEMALVREHPQRGSAMLERGGISNEVAEMILQHHERMDGSGYPNGLAGDKISIGARIVAVADVVEAMASHRPYRAALGAEVAVKEIERGSGTVYDPDVAAALLRLFRAGRLSLSTAWS